MRLLRLWFSKPQGRKASGRARTRGEGDVALEESAAGILEEEQGELWACPFSQRSQRGRVGPGLALDSVPYTCLKVGLAHRSPKTSLV